MNWWRGHHGISNDVKLAIIASRLGLPKCEVGWCWIIALDYASQHEEDRGNITGLEMEEIAEMAGISAERATMIIGAFIGRKMITDDGRLAAWDKRQPKRERPDDDSTVRVQRLRLAKRHVTPCNASDDQETPRTEQSRADTEQKQNRTDANFPETPRLLLHSRKPPEPAHPRDDSFDFEEWFRDRMRRHPNPERAMNASRLLAIHPRILDPEWRAEFERVHDLWIQSERWQWKNGARVKPMDDLVTDEFWLYPPQVQMSETDRAMEAL